MVREVEINRITELLGQNPAGLTIEQVSRQLSINRTTAAKYLNFLIASGQIRKRNLGPAKIFTLAARIPMSHFLNLWQDGIIIINNDLVVQQVNDQMITLLSLNRENLLGERITTGILTSYITPGVLQNLELAREGTEQVQQITLKIGDREEQFRLKIIPLALEQGETGFGLIFEQLPRQTEPVPDSSSGQNTSSGSPVPVAEDMEKRLSEFRKIEKALLESEAKYRALVENIAEVIFTINDHDQVTYVSPAIRNLTGHSPSDLMGRRFQEFVFTEDIVPFEKGLERTRRGTDGPIEFRLLTKQSSVRWVQVTGRSLTGKTPGTGFQGVMADIHERKQIEDALRHANKQIILLTSITRHDILNGITSLRLSFDLLRNEPLDEKFRKIVDQQERVVSQIQHQISFTRDYQNIGIRPPGWKDVGERFAAAVASRPAGKVAIQAEVKNIEIFSDDLIERVFANLIENTLEHGGKATTIRFFPEIRGKDLVLVFEDDGVGVPSDEKEQVFEHTRRGRISYGLFFSREVLAITGLSIRETGVAGSGARFEILVPEGLYR